MLRSPLTAAGLLLAVLTVVGLALERDESWQRLRGVAGSRSVPGDAVGSTRFGRALGELGLLHPVPRGRRPDAPAASLGPIPPRRGSTPDQLALAPPGGRHLLTAYRLDGIERARRLPVVSLLVPPADLAEMHAKRHLRGRQSEHPAYVGFFEDGELRSSGGGGVRVHGGASRASRALLSYRLTARRSYGAPVFAPAPFPESAETAASQLVLRANRGPDHKGRLWHFTSPLSLDVARRVGVPAPRSRPVLLVINGHDQGVYELVEYIGRKLVEQRFGLHDFVMVRTKQNRLEGERSKVKEGPEEPYLELRRRIQTLTGDASQDRADEWVDLDNLYRWLIAVTFLDTRDVFQGALVRDLSGPSGRWFWIAWDMDISFGLPHLSTQDGWRTNSLHVMLNKPRADARRHLFRWLMESPDERRRFVALATEVLNHRLDGEFLAGRIAFYRQQAEAFDLEDRRFLDELEEYLVNRPRGYRRHLQESLSAGPARHVRITGPPGAGLQIDGYPTELPWRGGYFDGQSLRLAAPAGTALTVNGEARTFGTEPLEIDLLGDLQIALATVSQDSSATSGTTRQVPSTSTRSRVLRTTSE